MGKLKKIKWLMFICDHDGVPAQTLTDDMNLVELYCTLVLLARLYRYVTTKPMPLDLMLALETAKYKYAKSKRGVEKKRLKYLKDTYNEFLFQWECDPLVKDIY